MKKERVDVLLFERGLIETREKAKRAVMAGIVYSNEERLDKPGAKIAIDAPLMIKGKEMPYVSRGGLKLEKALTSFQLELEHRIMVDIGSSTGGFTDCALQNGVKMSYAVDVGYNQLAWKLRNDDRVVVMERQNFRYAELTDFQLGQPDFATIDVSFISLTIILPALARILQTNGDCVCLVKPQFEAGREQVGKKGIVQDAKVHLAVLEKISRFALETGFNLCGLTYSPITGGDGNIEFLLHLRFTNQPGENQLPVTFTEVVEQAHQDLKNKVTHL